MKRAVGRRGFRVPDIEFAATVEAEHLRFREVPRIEVRFSGTPDHESSTTDLRRNLPDPVSQDVDYHDVRVDYLLKNHLSYGNGSLADDSPPRG